MAYDPELAPPPDPRGDRRILWIVGVLTVLLLAGLGFAEYLRSHASGSQKNAAGAFLRDVQNRNLTSAYARFCPAEQARLSQASFTTALQKAAARGHAISSFDIVSGNSTQRVPGGAWADVAQGTVKFSNGQDTVVTILLERSGGRLCVLDAGKDLF
jgi:hypothetical protein